MFGSPIFPRLVAKCIRDQRSHEGKYLKRVFLWVHVVHEVPMLLVNVVFVRPAIAIELHGESVDELFGVVRILIFRPLSGADKLSELILQMIHVPINGIVLRLVPKHKFFVAPGVRLHNV